MGLMDLRTSSPASFVRVERKDVKILTTRFMTTTRSQDISSLLFVCFLVFGSVAVRAATGSWTNNANSNWSITNNWEGRMIADGAGNTVAFDLTLSANRTVTMDMMMCFHKGDAVQGR